eukprot:4203653-Ditylum_brightwellii.AAC.1
MGSGEGITASITLIPPGGLLLLSLSRDFHISIYKWAWGIPNSQSVLPPQAQLIMSSEPHYLSIYPNV